MDHSLWFNLKKVNGSATIVTKTNTSSATSVLTAALFLGVSLLSADMTAQDRDHRVLKVKTN